MYKIVLSQENKKGRSHCTGSDLLVKYREPESNRHECNLIGVWDQRVYQFRHPGKFPNADLRLGVQICKTGFDFAKRIEKKVF